MLFEMFSARNCATSSGNSRPRSLALRFRIAILVSNAGCSISATRPHLNRETRRSWREGISFGGLSLLRTICF
jgi:hypothetical protein